MANDGMHELKEEFRLVDVDEVVLSSPNYVVIREPAGFDALMINLKREIEDRGGVNFEYGDSESSLGFDHYDDVYDTVNTILAANGSDSNIKFEYYHVTAGVYDLVYSGYFVPSSKSESDFDNRFRIKRTDFGDKMRTRYDLENPIEGDTNLDGTKTNLVTLPQIGLHSKTLLTEGLKNVDAPVFYDDLTLTTGIFYDAGFLWGMSEFNDLQKSLDNFYNYPSTFLFEDNAAGLTDQEKYASRNPLVQSGQPHYRCTTVSEELVVSLIHDYQVSVDIQGNLGGNDAVRSMRATMWVVNDGVFQYVVNEFFDDTVGARTYVKDIAINYSTTLNLVDGDEVYYGFDFFCGGTVNSQTVEFNLLQTLGESGVFEVTSRATVRPSLCRGSLIFESLNKMLQNAIGATETGELTVKIDNIAGIFPNTRQVLGEDSGATGTIFQQLTPNFLGLVDVEGTFVSGENLILVPLVGLPDTLAPIEYINSGTLGTATIQDGNILKSSLLEREEQNGTADGCASLNFVTNGFAIRDFVPEDYNNDKYYKDGDRVVYLNQTYLYIADTITKNNLPTDTDFWEVQEFRQVKSSIKKLVDFVKFRYGAGMAIVKETGNGSTKKRVRVLIEKAQHFFNDVEILNLVGFESLNVGINKDVIFNEVKAGYEVFAEPNDKDSLSGFATKYSYLLPIEKDKKTLSLTAKVGVDGYEIERLRRLSQAEAPKESDSKDDETFIISCFRADDTNKVDPSIYGDDIDVLGLVIDKANWTDTTVVEVRGLLLPQLVAGDRIVVDTLGGIEERIIQTVTLSARGNLTELKLDNWIEDTISLAFQSFGTFYFKDSTGAVKKDIYIPKRLEGFTSVVNSPDSKTEYNIDHVVSNSLIENYPWFGSGLNKKADSSLVKFLDGKNNIFFGKQNAVTGCENNTVLTQENQDYTLQLLRAWKSEIFTEDLYTITGQLGYEDFRTLRDSLIAEQGAKDFGYVTVKNNQGSTKKVFPFEVKYNASTLTTEIKGWGSAL
ncbi:hypothetical protein N9936_01260 [bacterium]|nr:hypothetical protein [bacterium]